MNFNESQYNFDYNCVYFLTSEEEEKEINANTNSNHDTKHSQYQRDFLNIFYLDEYEGKKVLSITDYLWSCIMKSDDDAFKKIIRHYCTDINGFLFLFAFDSLNAFHICIKDLYNNGIVKPSNIQFLESQIK